MKVRIAVFMEVIKVTLVLFLIVGLVLINGCGRKEEKQPSVKETEEISLGRIIPEKRGEKAVIKKGDRIKVQYTGSLNDGTIFDKSKEEEPLEFTVGSGQIIPGFDKAVEGMKLNEEKKVTINPEDAYGKRDETAIREFPKNSLLEDFKPEKGMVIRLQDQTGRAIPGTVTDIAENNITIDLNHPLAGKELTFNIKVIGIE